MTDHFVVICMLRSQFYYYFFFKPSKNEGRKKLKNLKKNGEANVPSGRPTRNCCATIIIITVIIIIYIVFIYIYLFTILQINYIGLLRNLARNKMTDHFVLICMLRSQFYVNLLNLDGCQ